MDKSFMELQVVERMNRRKFLTAGAMVAAGVMVGVKEASASFNGLIDGMKREAKTAPVTIKTIKPGYCVLENTGGNITIFNAADATLIVDSGIAEQHVQVLKAVEEMKKAPVREVINTHWHFDHTSGNPWFGEGGARLTAHENTLKHLLVPTKVTPWSYTFEPIPESGRPTNLLKGDSLIEMGHEHASIHFVANAHTDGDLLVRFEHGDVVSTGDIFWNGHYPFIDNECGGSIDGMIRATDLALSLSTAKTTFIPGHGPVGSRSDVQEYAEMLKTIRSLVAALKAKGLSPKEAIAARPTARFDSKYGDFAVAPDDFAALVYMGI